MENSCPHLSGLLGDRKQAFTMSRELAVLERVQDYREGRNREALERWEVPKATPAEAAAAPAFSASVTEFRLSYPILLLPEAPLRGWGGWGAGGSEGVGVRWELLPLWRRPARAKPSPWPPGC